MAETQIAESTLVLEFESRITKLKTSFQESIVKMMKLMHKTMREVSCDVFDNLLEIVVGLLRDQENIKKGVEGLKAEFENSQKKSGEKKEELEEFQEAIEGFCKQEDEIHKRLDELKNQLDSDEDDDGDDSDCLEFDMSIEEAEQALYRIFFWKHKDDQRADEGSSSRNEASVEKDPKIEVTYSSSDSSGDEWYKQFPKSDDLLKQDCSEREAVIEGLKQDFEKLQLVFSKGRKIKDKGQSQEECPSSSNSRQMKEEPGVIKSHSI